MGRFTTEEIEEYLKRVIVSRFNDHLGENLDSLFNLPGKYDELSEGLQKRLQEDFSHLGLSLNNLYITSITPPPEVQQTIDDKSRLGVIQDMDKLIKMKAAMALEKASESEGSAGTGVGMGMGFMMPAMFAGAFQSQTGPAPATGGAAAGVAAPASEIQCPDCHHNIPQDSRFCPLCGHQLVVHDQCQNCGKNLPPNAKFCPKCGRPADEKPEPKFCSKCGTENLPGAGFCNQCGEKLD
jgi:membrane protease subunit (stomatin/prohibitin family)